jgi:hypothetical protein
MVTVKAAGKLPKQGLLVKARTTGQSRDYWPKQGLLAKATIKLAFPRQLDG